MGTFLKLSAMPSAQHTGVTTGSGVLQVVENKNLRQPDL